MTTVLTVDLGTGGPKVAFVTTTGTVRWWEHTQVETRFGPGGLATQDADHWWQVIRASLARGLRQVPADEVAAVAITGQWASTIPVDAAGMPTGPCLMWLDEQGGPLSRGLVGGPVMGYHPARLASWLRRTGAVPSTTGADPIGHMLWLEQHTPPGTRWYLEPVDYLAMRFTRQAAATHASMTAAWLTDNRDLSTFRYDETLVGLTGIDPARLPPLVPTSSVIGPIHPGVATELGLRTTVQVITGLPDLHAACVGSGAVEVGSPHMSIGTTGWISAPVTAKRTDLVNQMATVPGLDNRHYLLGNNQESAGRALAWYREALAPLSSFDDLLTEAAVSPPGAGRVMFTPWIAGERSPVENKQARGGFHNLSAASTRADLTRAVLEGVAHNTAWLLGPSEKFIGARLDPITVIGGGARSDLWLQIVADVTQRNLRSPEQPLLSGVVGMGLVAGVALGEIGWSDVPNLVNTPRHFEPNRALADLYAARQREVPKLFGMHKGFFARLNG